MKGQVEGLRKTVSIFVYKGVVIFTRCAKLKKCLSLCELCQWLEIEFIKDKRSAEVFALRKKMAPVSVCMYIYDWTFISTPTLSGGPFPEFGQAFFSFFISFFFITHAVVMAVPVYFSNFLNLVYS